MHCIKIANQTGTILQDWTSNQMVIIHPKCILYAEYTCNFFWAEASPSAEMPSSLIACRMSISINVVIWTSGTLTPFEMDFSMAETCYKAQKENDANIKNHMACKEDRKAD